MSQINITEFTGQASDDNSRQVPAGMLVENSTSQNVSFNNVGFTQSNVFRPTTTFIRVVSDVDCYIKVGIDPVATTDSLLLKANQVEYFGVRTSAQQVRIAVLGV